jgi:Ser/Thr protein kinase RdoA (MazF antagonist)
MSGTAPYAGLTPDCVLDALESAGWHGDGRLLALNSYENRVYQVWRDVAPPLVAKF